MSMNASDRRQLGARVPFEALVEIAAPEGSSFEAESVDLSATGMHLRTAYLPKVGTPLQFRFEATESQDAVLVGGEVVWSHDGDGGSEFGVRFSDMGARDAEMIQRIVSITSEIPGRPGSAVRIHIDGMSAPMKATLRDRSQKGAVVGSELKMLRLGAIVELEDKDRLTRRTARVDGVACEIDPETSVPQLVIKFRYPEDAVNAAADRELPFLTTKKVPMPADVETAAKDLKTATLPPPAMSSQPPPASEQARVALPVAAEPEGKLGAVKDGMRSFGDKMKDVLGDAGAAATRFGARVGTTVSLLAKRKGEDADVVEEGEARRTTATVSGSGTKRTLRPQGASRDFMSDGSGRDEEIPMHEIDNKKVARRRQVGIAAGIGMAVLLGFFAFRKPAKTEPVVQAPTPELAPAASAPLPLPPPAVAPVDSALAAAATPPVVTPAALVGDSTGVDTKGNPNPFGTPGVKKGTKMILKLDGPVTELKGLQMPNGFVVSVPNRKSLEAAGPLAAKDPRIGSAKVVNQPGGAELTIAFKDSGTTPPYVVKAKGDSIEIVLAHEKAIAKKGKTKGQAPAKAPHKKK